MHFHSSDGDTDRSLRSFNNSLVVDVISTVNSAVSTPQSRATARLIVTVVIIIYYAKWQHVHIIYNEQYNKKRNTNKTNKIAIKPE